MTNCNYATFIIMTFYYITCIGIHRLIIFCF